MRRESRMLIVVGAFGLGGALVLGWMAERYTKVHMQQGESTETRQPRTQTSRKQEVEFPEPAAIILG